MRTIWKSLNITSSVYAWDICMHVRISWNISSFIHLNTSLEDVRIRNSTDESEYSEHSIVFICFNLSNFTGFYVLNCHPGKDSISSNFLNNCIPHKVKFVVFESFLLNGFCCTQLITSVNDCNFSSEFCKVHSLFNSGISTTYYIYLKILEEVSVTSSAVRNSSSKELCLTLAADWSCMSTCSNDNILCLILTFFTFEDFYISLK